MDKVLQLFKRDLLNKYSETTVKTYIFELKQFNDWLNITGTNIFNYKKIDVINYFNFLTSKKSGSATVNKIFHAIKIFSIWIDKYIFMENIRRTKPVNINKEEEKTDNFGEESLLKLLIKIKLSGTLRDLAIIMLMFHTKIKVSECVMINKSDIDFANGTLKVNENVFKLSKELLYILKTLIISGNQEHEELFISNRDKRISIRSIQGIFKKYNIQSKYRKYYLAKS